MRPLNLTMQAFGPFPSKIEISFESLGQNNIYLISGVTGSGKTTIFDAICYALFNSSSGENRGTSTLKSHFAKDDIESYVKFSFIFNNEKYTILRHPSYLRKKSRGDGYIQENAKAQIELPDGKIIEKTKEVDDYIKNLLGIDCAQFSQIALLAQGEFLKLLNADSQTRCEIFRSIFKTWNYSNFQKTLKDETIIYKNKYESTKNSILQYIKDIQSTNENLCSLKDKYIENDCFDDLKNFLDLLKNQNIDDENSLIEIKKEISSIEEKIKNSQNEFLKIKNKINLTNEKNKAQLQKEELEKSSAKINEDYKNIDNKKKKLENLSLEIKKSDENYKKTIEIKELTNQKENKEKEYETILITLKTIKNNLKSTQLNHIQSLQNALITIKDEIKTQQDLFISTQNEYDNLAKDYLKNYNDYLKSQAGILAQNLKENEPCPVCGSKKHPNLARLEDKSLNQNFIDELKNKVELKNKILAELAKECSILKEKEQNLKNNINSLKTRYNINCKDEYMALSNKDYEKEILSIEKEIENLTEQKNKNNNELNILTGKIETLSKDIDTKNIEKILENHKLLNKEYDKLELEIKKTEKDYLDNSLLIAQLSSKINVLNSQLKPLKETDIEKLDILKQEIQIFENAILNLDNNLKQILIRKTMNENLYNSISEKYSEFREINSKYSDYKILSDCANGNLKGCTRITFEQYIQGYYLDMILNEANKRLKIMTQNQFQLLRKKDATSLQSKTGLDLEVMDFHTYKKRSTKTLSGGESFKAALSLALGLSDCVSNLSGAINIDAMFIDEGFGSLDSESLELAMEVISNLSLNNRLIGIISHIDELKNKIQNQIITTKSENGSNISINF